MSTPRLRRSIAGGATVILSLASLAIWAEPTAAAVHTASLAGEITLTKTGVTETLAVGASTSCSTPPVSMTFDLGTEVVGASVSVTAFSSSHVQTYSTGSYLTVFTRSTAGNTAGMLGSSTTGHTISTFRLGLASTVYNTTSCTPTGTPVCTVAALLALSGTSTSTTDGNSFILTGASVGSVVAFPTCTAGPSQILSTTSTTSPLYGFLGGGTPQVTGEGELDSGGDIVITNGTTTVTIPPATAGSGCLAGPIYWVHWLFSYLEKTSSPSITRFQMGTTYYVASITHVSNTQGTSSGGSFSGSTEVVQMNIYTATNQGATDTDCTHGTTLQCSLEVPFGLQGTTTVPWYSSRVSNWIHESPNDSAYSITGSSCSAPFTSLVGGSANADSRRIHIEKIL